MREIKIASYFKLCNKRNSSFTTFYISSSTVWLKKVGKNTFRTKPLVG